MLINTNIIEYFWDGNMRVFSYEELKDAPLLIDAIYKSKANNYSGEPLPVLLPKTSNQGGFRISCRKDDAKMPAYIVISTTMKELEWPDFLDVEEGVFRYYGDNRKPGKDLHDTPRKGNLLLKNIFQWLHEDGDSRKNIPPILIFKKTGDGRDVQFLGLAAPGNPSIPPDRDLISFWRTMEGKRFQNYEAYFSILDTKNEEIKKEWLVSLYEDHENSLELAPKVWQDFIKKGRNGIKPLKAPKIVTIPTKNEQLPHDNEGKGIVKFIHEYYAKEPSKFEKCATKIVQMMDSNFYRFDVTRPWRDGGRDAIGKYHIGPEEHSLSVDCALEAKCYGDGNSVGVKEMSRLISRIKYRQFGIMVTTSSVNSQAYKEVVDDGHPILIITGKDIAEILRKNGIGLNGIKAWLEAMEN